MCKYRHSPTCCCSCILSCAVGIFIKMSIKEGNISDLKKKKKEQQINKSRLIIRNLSFKATEDEIRKAFAAYGNIVNVSIPKKDDGKPKGFAFLSYDNVGSSLKAIKHINGKKILKRKVAVDFSLPKDSYLQLQATKNDSTKNDDASAENENDSEEEEEDDEDDEIKEKIEEDDDVASEIDSGNDSENDISDDESENSERLNKKRSKKPSDVLEEKTIFIRNLDLDTTEESLSKLLETFGPLEYCKICINQYTEKSRGMAFAKFKSKESAEQCLKEGAQGDSPRLFIDGQQLNVTLALPKNKVIELENAKHNKHKDKRNLYLAKEGLIYPNSPAAAGVSQADLKKRVQQEERKRKMLQNNHYFISDRRLCIHNLPPSINDTKLRELFQKAANDKSAQILWAKVMCNRSKTDNKLGNSKGFGFVEFSDHVHALKALRHLNNNPEIFTPEKRPIVEFSVENKVALNRKKYRQLKQQKMENSASDSKQMSTTGSDLEVDQGFSGVMTKALTNDDKVIQPKVNRKIGEVKNQLKKKKKEIKAAKKKRQNLERHHKKQERKDQNPKKRKEFAEEEVFDSHFKKRKHVFTSEQSQRTPTVMKKAKWFNK